MASNEAEIRRDEKLKIARRLGGMASHWARLARAEEKKEYSTHPCVLQFYAHADVLAITADRFRQEVKRECEREADTK